MAGLLENLAEKLATEAISEFAQIWSVQDDVEQLESILSTVKAVVEAAEEQPVSDKPLSNWLWKLKDAAYDAEDLLEEIEMEAERRKAVTHGQLSEQVADFFSLSNPFIFGFRMTSEIKKIRARMDQISAEKERFHLEARQPQGRQMVIRERETWSKMDEMSINGRDDDKESIIRMVMDTEVEENVSVIPVVGIGGLGKTTLARLVYNDERVGERHFNLRMWVYVSMDFDPRRIGKAMMECMTGQKCELETLDVIGNQLREKLNGKRFLLVLDDVWTEDEDEWEKLKPIFNVGAKGSKIVVTTRGEKVASIMKTRTIYHLKGLSKEACWALFKKRAFEGGDEEQDPSTVAIGKEIVNKCVGVPMAVKALGSMMRFEKGKEAWLAVRDSKMWKLTDKVLSSLRLSYTCLPSHLKQCFTYCSIFPKGYEIDKDDLIAQWIAQGFISSTVEGRQMEDIGNQYFNDLLWLSFFQDLQQTVIGRVKCKMHDLVHDLAQLVAGGEILVLEHRKAMTSIDKRCRWLALVDYDISLEFPISLKKMRALKFYRTPSNDVEERCNFKFARSMFSGAQSLRALDLEVVDIEFLPVFVGNLRNLRYLRISYEKPLPESFYSLQNLQTLHLSNCIGLEKISESINRLCNLRSLVLSNCDLVTLPESIGDLRDLRNLDVIHCGSLQTTPESIGKLQNLQRINLSACYRLMELPDSIGYLSNLQELHLCGCSELRRLPESISNLVHLKKLDLRECSSLEELPRELGNMINLRYLITEYCDSLFGITLGVGRLTNLQALAWFVVGDGREYARVSELEHLNQISGDLEISGLRNVRDPQDARRAKLKEKQNLSSLFLKWKMPADDSKTAVEKEGNEEAVLESLQPYSNIHNLVIWDYPGVSFPNWIRLSPFPNLESVDLRGLKNCKDLPPLGLLPSLRDLRIERMDSVKRIGEEFNGVGHHSSSKAVPFPSLRRLNFYDMSNLEEWCTVVEVGSSGHRAPLPFPCLSTLEISSCPNLRVQSGFPASVVDLKVSASNEELLSVQSFQQNASCLREVAICYASSTRWMDLQCLTFLQTLHVEHCDSLSVLPEWLGELTSLHSLEIDHCTRLTCLPQGLQRLTGLKSLQISGCPKLAMRCERERGEDWHIIAHIPCITIDRQRI